MRVCQVGNKRKRTRNKVVIQLLTQYSDIQMHGGMDAQLKEKFSNEKNKQIECVSRGGLDFVCKQVNAEESLLS